MLAAVWVAYSGSRLLADDSLSTAQRRAEQIVGVESWLGIDIESWLNHAASPITWIGVTTSYWYVVLHYLVTPAALVYLFLRRRRDYPRARNALVIGSALAVAGYMLLPTAPPRLMDGYVDTLARYANYGWWSSHASAPAGLGGLTNELAAMPSLHVGWTLWVAWALWSSANHTGRALLSTYVVGTLLVVIATGNHWVLDALAGLLVVAAGILVASRSTRLLTPSGRCLACQTYRGQSDLAPDHEPLALLARGANATASESVASDEHT